MRLSSRLLLTRLQRVWMSDCDRYEIDLKLERMKLVSHWELFAQGEPRNCSCYESKLEPHAELQQQAVNRK